ncbi:hypothetical protein [Bradyrhizobium sp. BWA-3-5]|uniref:hypothetical protein n=1 Tax=Bradyrhizobium sp. BWA-3-5 TaxID=3080013 RepID=UPI00293E549B|nr:hypothetical protein [Bradyrhizobium sp. BWA-3-5]WOH64160.1 hypothetical protein RX331_26680 [Bradyrhizobium sp. BWA-3-5]WOH64277.1 hypothetical protein RX331_27420 [Bradyrhizobium sp. BWA-3-5]
MIHAEERGTPKNRKKIDWKLITDLPVDSRADAIEKLEWYALRWKIEVFHKILKSGCKAEESKLRTAQRLTNLISLFCILTWRVFWMTMLNRSAPDAPPTLALTATEIGVLDGLVNDNPKARQKTLSHYLIKIARLGGYLARASDPPPGNTVMWRGLSRLTDIALGAMAGVEFVGIESFTGRIPLLRVLPMSTERRPVGGAFCVIPQPSLPKLTERCPREIARWQFRHFPCRRSQRLVSGV